MSEKVLYHYTVSAGDGFVEVDKTATDEEIQQAIINELNEFDYEEAVLPLPNIL